MSHISYPAGSAFAQALRLGSDFAQHEDRPLYRTVDLVNIGAHCAELAHSLLQRDPAEARAHLIRGASRMLAAAEALGQGGAAPTVVHLPVRRERPALKVVK